MANEQDAAQPVVELTKFILQGLILHYQGEPSREKVLQALDALATAVSMTVCGLGADEHKARTYFNLRLKASVEQSHRLDALQ